MYFNEGKETLISFYIFTLKKYALQNVVSEIFFSFEVFYVHSSREIKASIFSFKKEKKGRKK